MKIYRATITYEVRARNLESAQKKVAKLKGRPGVRLSKVKLDGGWKA